MGINKQNQTSGDNSNQFQNCSVTIANAGISEERVRAIFSEMFEIAKKEFTQEALQIAQQRVGKFEDIFIPKLMESEERMNALRDPSFQFMLIDANKKAACMDRKVDYDLLSELLIHRTKNIQNREKNAGLNVAISIIDQIDDDSLRGLSLAYIVSRFIPVTSNISEGFQVLDDLYGSLIKDGSLPSGNNWLENLDLLKCVRLSNFTSQYKLEQIIKNKCKCYFCHGISKNSPEYDQAIEIIKKNQLPHDILIEHELFPGNLRLPVVNEEYIKKLSVIKQITNGDGVAISRSVPFTDEQTKAMIELLSLCNKNNDDKAIEQKIKEEISKYGNIAKTMVWWNSINIGFSLTSAGRVLAHANASRLKPDLPSFED